MVEKRTGPGIINSGIYIVSKEIMSKFAGNKFSLNLIFCLNSKESLRPTLIPHILSI
jgi:NDP-sugar pyrophosphorylase family protein